MQRARKALSSIFRTSKLSVMSHTCDPSTWEEEAGKTSSTALVYNCTKFPNAVIGVREGGLP